MKKIKKDRLRKEVFVKAEDDWYPCYPNSTVKLSLNKYNYDGIFYRVSVWGDDDFGMDKDYHTNDPSEVLKLYNKIVKRGGVDKEYLKSLGFEVF